MKMEDDALAQVNMIKSIEDIIQDNDISSFDLKQQVITPLVCIEINLQRIVEDKKRPDHLDPIKSKLNYGNIAPNKSESTKECKEDQLIINIINDSKEINVFINKYNKVTINNYENERGSNLDISVYSHDNGSDQNKLINNNLINPNKSSQEIITSKITEQHRNIKDDPECDISNPEHSSAALNSPNNLIWEEDGHGFLIIGDSWGVAGKVKIGSTPWAILTVLKTEASNSYLDLKKMGTLIDFTCSKWDQAKDCIKSGKEIDGDDKYDNMHILKRKNQFNRPTFSDLSAGEIREKAQSNLRKIKGEKDKALAWRRRWIHWDLNKYTVLFENKG